MKSGGINLESVTTTLKQLDLEESVEARELHRQVIAVGKWVRESWKGADCLVETPVQEVTGDGQIVGGRMDLVIHAADGWVLMDHKSTLATKGIAEGNLAGYGGQLAAYSEALVRATGKPLQSAWIVMPVAGKAVRIMALFGQRGLSWAASFVARSLRFRSRREPIE
ncbi:MAG: PD-(D/E)XK nuclease family protein [Betaproteobacteria bacterium]|nr:PD-(D/E)XK nuclease family protein [Betaproteobacteria bacterium]